MFLPYYAKDYLPFIFRFMCANIRFTASSTKFFSPFCRYPPNFFLRFVGTHQIFFSVLSVPTKFALPQWKNVRQVEAPPSCPWRQQSCIGLPRWARLSHVLCAIFCPVLNANKILSEHSRNLGKRPDGEVVCPTQPP